MILPSTLPRTSFRESWRCLSALSIKCSSKTLSPVWSLTMLTTRLKATPSASKSAALRNSAKASILRLASTMSSNSAETTASTTSCGKPSVVMMFLNLSVIKAIMLFSVSSSAPLYLSPVWSMIASRPVRNESLVLRWILLSNTILIIPIAWRLSAYGSEVPLGMSPDMKQDDILSILSAMLRTEPYSDSGRSLSRPVGMYCSSIAFATSSVSPDSSA